MPQIVNWEYYSSLYDVISEVDFTRAEKKAEREVSAVIGPIRWASITEKSFGYMQLQDCICKVMDKMAEDEKVLKRKGITSVNNDGYSESYSVQTEEQLRQEMQCSIREWLSGTGLVGAY